MSGINQSNILKFWSHFCNCHIAKGVKSPSIEHLKTQTFFLLLLHYKIDLYGIIWPILANIRPKLILAIAVHFDIMLIFLKLWKSSFECDLDLDLNGNWILPYWFLCLLKFPKMGLFIKSWVFLGFMYMLQAIYF